MWTLVSDWDAKGIFPMSVLFPNRLDQYYVLILP